MNSKQFKSQNGHAAPGNTISRRSFLTRVGVAAAGAMIVPSAEAFSKTLSRDRRLTLFNTNTNEELSIVCSPEQQYDVRMLARFNHFLRDHHSGQVRSMDPALIDLLYAVSVLTRSQGEYTVFSGYRTQETNELLRKLGHGTAEHSMHIQGKAIDLRMPDVDIRSIRQAAVALQQGGVGYYPSSNFVHIDTGSVRTW